MNRKVEHQPKLKLHYFDIKGKGEPIRLFCAFAGLELDDFRFSSREQFTAMKESGKLAFGQVPMLEVDGKHQLVQTASILRYLAKLSDLYPADPLIAAKVDAAMDQETDAFTGLTVATYSVRFGIPLDDEMKSKCHQLIYGEVLPRHLGNVEKLFQSSSTGWIAGTVEPSPADFAWFVRLDSLLEKTDLPESLRGLNNYPLCKAFLEKFKALQAIKEYYTKN